tara:strand:+ start:6654 stop:7460 length:807 start_codon:yes stop_codon:yes gene_type:complete
MTEMEEKYMSLITEYMDGTLTDERRREFEEYVEQGFIDMQEVNELRTMGQQMATTPKPEPTDALHSNFYQMLAAEQSRVEGKEDFRHVWSVLGRFFFATSKGRFAFGFCVLLVGLVLGRLFTGSVYNSQLNRLSDQMAGMQEVMMKTMLEDQSVTQRLKGVQMSNGLVSKNREVTDALFLTLNNDESTNVRLAALASLANYAKDSAIRERLIKSINQQRSPLVLVAMAELMVDMQETQAVKAFEPILNAENTPDDVKSALRENLDKIM